MRACPSSNTPLSRLAACRGLHPDSSSCPHSPFTRSRDLQWFRGPGSSPLATLHFPTPAPGALTTSSWAWTRPPALYEQNFWPSIQIEFGCRHWRMAPVVGRVTLRAGRRLTCRETSRPVSTTPSFGEAILHQLHTRTANIEHVPGLPFCWLLRLTSRKLNGGSVRLCMRFCSRKVARLSLSAFCLLQAASASAPLSQYCYQRHA
jgi:hypothetical protein